MGTAHLYHLVSAFTNKYYYFSISTKLVSIKWNKKKEEYLSFEGFNVMIKAAFLFILTRINVFCFRNLRTQVYRTLLQKKRKMASLYPNKLEKKYG